MPIIEANQQGLPIICSDIPVLHEIANDSAIFVSPYNIKEIHDKFKMLINNRIIRQDLAQKGYTNLKRFQKDIILNQWLSLYCGMSNNI